jgi:hypothetical protein
VLSKHETQAGQFRIKHTDNQLFYPPPPYRSICTVAEAKGPIFVSVQSGAPIESPAKNGYKVRRCNCTAFHLHKLSVSSLVALRSKLPAGLR